MLRTRFTLRPRALVATLALLMAPASAAAATTDLVTVETGGSPAGWYAGPLLISDDARIVAWQGGDQVGRWRDRTTAQTTPLLLHNGAPVTARPCDMTQDGRYVVFVANVPGEPDGGDDLYRRDLVGGALVRVSEPFEYEDLGSQDPDITPATRCGISDDGNRIVYAGPIYGTSHVLLRDVAAGTTIEVSRNDLRDTWFGESYMEGREPAISGDGNRVAFRSSGAGVGEDTNEKDDVYLRVIPTGRTYRVSVGAGGIQGAGPSMTPALDQDGDTVVFASSAENFGAGAGNGRTDVFLRHLGTDPATGDSVLVSANHQGAAANGSSYSPSVDDTGEIVAFTSLANDIVGDGNEIADVFVRDVARGTTEIASLTRDFQQPQGGSTQAGVISGNGRYVPFVTSSSLSPSNGWEGFLRDRSGNRPPSARFTATPGPLRVDVDGTPSTDPDAAIAGWAWDFGDGGTGTGARASHVYAKPGIYEVTLVVTDSDGTTATWRESVEVPGPTGGTGTGSGTGTGTGTPGTGDPVGGGTGPTGDPVVTPRVAIDRLKRAGRNLRVRLRCPAGVRLRCAGRLQIKAGRTVIATRSFSLLAATAKTLTLKPTRAGRRALSRSRSLRVVATARSRDGGGTPPPTTRRLTIKRS